MVRLIVTLMLCSTAMPAEATCLASAIVEGDAPVVANVRSELARRGVSEPSDPSCTVTRAWVTQEDGRFRVKVQDGAGRESERVVSDEASVAILVESWVRPELTTWTAPAAITDSHKTPALYVGARAEVGVDVTGTLAYGASADVTLPVHAYQLGVVVRALTSSDITGSYGPGASRLGIDVLADAARAVRARGVVVTPGIALGVGWLATSGAVSDSTVSSIGLRASVHLALALPVAPLWSIELLTSGDFAPFAHGDPYMNVAKGLPGEPWLTARAGLGLRMAVP